MAVVVSHGKVSIVDFLEIFLLAGDHGVNIEAPRLLRYL
jgi:hypothetical protein